MKKLILVVLLVSIVRGVIAADWPRWRGANYDDISTETGLLQSWPSTGPKRIWLSRDIGARYPAPSISNGNYSFLELRTGGSGYLPSPLSLVSRCGLFH